MPRSEYTDITSEIARSKAMARHKGPWMRKCSICGEIYKEEDKGKHNQTICKPLQKVYLVASSLKPEAPKLKKPHPKVTGTLKRGKKRKKKPSKKIPEQYDVKSVKKPNGNLTPKKKLKITAIDVSRCTDFYISNTPYISINKEGEKVVIIYPLFELHIRKRTQNPRAVCTINMPCINPSQFYIALVFNGVAQPSSRPSFFYESEINYTFKDSENNQIILKKASKIR